MDQKVLSEFSLTIEPGETVAFVGPSGSGKSTVFQLLERFYDPNRGQVLIDGVDLTSINLSHFRKQVGYVGQEPVLLNTSIKNNIRFCKPNATDQEILDALKSARAQKFVLKNSEGVDMIVGNDKLSGGQKQRISLAQAFVKKPKILLLDEATSALDHQNELQVQKAIDNIRTELG